jgi:membrane-associated phospholipid phosphatase
LCKVLQVVQRERVRTRGWLVGLAVLCAAVYAATWLGWVLGWGWVVMADASTLGATHRVGVAHSGWVTFWDAWCNVFSPLSFRVLTLGFIGYALVRRERRVALFLLLAVELSGVVAEGAKRLADRPRPSTAFVEAPSTSFPSGHAVGSMVAVLALAVVLLPPVRRPLRRWIAFAGVVVVLSVGFGRVALNVHHLSDVVAGWALGYLYFAACLVVLRAPRVTEAAETPAAPGTAR